MDVEGLLKGLSKDALTKMTDLMERQVGIKTTKTPLIMLRDYPEINTAFNAMIVKGEELAEEAASRGSIKDKELREEIFGRTEIIKKDFWGITHDVLKTEGLVVSNPDGSMPDLKIDNGVIFSVEKVIPNGAFKDFLDSKGTEYSNIWKTEDQVNENADNNLKN